jgi:predicted transcriptional regulator
MTIEQLREIDKTVLHHIAEGLDDTQKITEATTLETHKVRYSLEKLEQQGLITVENPDRMVERVIDGQKRVFQHPKQAELTKAGEESVEQVDRTKLNEYSDLSHRELVRKARDLEDRVADMERKFEVFRSQVLEKIDSG